MYYSFLLLYPLSLTVFFLTFSNVLKCCLSSSIPLSSLLSILITVSILYQANYFHFINFFVFSPVYLGHILCLPILFDFLCLFLWIRWKLISLQPWLAWLSWVGGIPHKSKGRRFSSRSGYMPGLRVQSMSGYICEVASGCFSPSSPPPPLSKNLRKGISPNLEKVASV